MNLKAHLNIRLKRINDVQSLIKFMKKQGFIRTGQNTWECVTKPFLCESLTIIKSDNHYEVTL